MIRWFMSPTSNTTEAQKMHTATEVTDCGLQIADWRPQSEIRNPKSAILPCAAVVVLWCCSIVWAAPQREPVTMRVVAVNPSSEKSRTVPVRIDLPQEIKPSDILNQGELEVEFDTERSLYYMHKDNVELGPKQTKVFELVVQDVWFIPDEELEGLKGHTSLMLQRLAESEYYPFAKQLSASILQRLGDIQQMQADETIGRKQRIGAFRTNTQTLKVVKEDLTRMEKLLSFTGGPPVPEMLEESPLKSDAPSTTTTWLVIFLVITFMGLLAGQFFFTWQRRLKMTPEFSGESAPDLSTSSARPGSGAEDDRTELPSERTSSTG